jgi:hypothetical protein
MLICREAGVIKLKIKHQKVKRKEKGMEVARFAFFAFSLRERTDNGGDVVA